MNGPRRASALALAGPPLAGAVGVGLGLAWPVYGPLLVAGVFALIVLQSSPRLALAVLAFLAAFDDYIGPAVIYRDFLVADVVGLTLIAAQLRQPARLPRARGLTLGVCALALFCALNVMSLGPANWSEALDNVARLMYFTVLVAAVGLAWHAVRLREVAGALVAGMVVRFLYEARYYFASPSFVLHFSYQFGGMTSNANTLAGLGACVLPLSCSLLLRASRWTRVLAALSTLVLVAGIFLSYSKGAWVTSIVSMAAWTAEMLRRRWIDVRPFVAAAAIAIVLIAAAPQVRQFAALAVDRWTSQASVISNRERVRYLATAGDFMQDHPIAGIGLERFGAAYLQAHQLPRGPDDPHNAYLLVGAELGVPALGCLLFVLFVALFTAFRNSATTLTEAPTRLALTASIIAMLVFQLFSAEPLSSRVCWVILALALTPRPPAWTRDAAA